MWSWEPLGEFVGNADSHRISNLEHGGPGDSNALKFEKLVQFTMIQFTKASHNDSSLGSPADTAMLAPLVLDWCDIDFLFVCFSAPRGIEICGKI